MPTVMEKEEAHKLIDRLPSAASSDYARICAAPLR